MESTNNKANILLVDNHRIFSETMADILRSAGYNVFTDDGHGGIGRIVEKIKTNKASIILQDILLNERYDGIDILKTVKEDTDWIGEVIVMSAQGTIDLGRQALKLGALKCLSKSDRLHEVIFRDIEKASAAVVEKKKNFYLGKLLDIIERKPLELVFEDPADLNYNGSSSEKFLTVIERVVNNNGKYEFREIVIEVAALRLTHTNPMLGSCLSVACGCRKKCPLCFSGNFIPYDSELTAEEIVLSKELVLRESAVYDGYFWENDSPFFIALMGSGDFAFNSTNCIKAMEIIKQVFGERMVCNISTAFSSGIKKLIKYVENQPKFIANLQISIHGYDKASRRFHVDSTRGPEELLILGERYASLTNTVLTLNYALTDKNNHADKFVEFLRKANPELSRVKISSVYHLPENSGLTPDNDSLILFAKLAGDLGFRTEIFDDKRQMGINSGTHCGGITNKIPWRRELL
jgi:adenine C2-methylase RlmN of 23S rRNA A2503 and tRNA A37/FixJ family two-component response regulator